MRAAALGQRVGAEGSGNDGARDGDGGQMATGGGGSKKSWRRPLQFAAVICQLNWGFCSPGELRECRRPHHMEPGAAARTRPTLLVPGTARCCQSGRGSEPETQPEQHRGQQCWRAMQSGSLPRPRVASATANRHPWVRCSCGVLPFTPSSLVAGPLPLRCWSTAIPARSNLQSHQPCRPRQRPRLRMKHSTL